jgi:hypothetical protein
MGSCARSAAATRRQQPRCRKSLLDVEWRIAAPIFPWSSLRKQGPIITAVSNKRIATTCRHVKAGGYGSRLALRLAGTTRHIQIKIFQNNHPLAARIASESCKNPSRPKRGRRECRAFLRARSLACETKKHTSIVTTGSPKRSGIPCAMVLRLAPRSPR